MSDNDKRFHEFALQSILFKGRHDWYFCYLKAERIAHVLALFVGNADPAHRDGLEELSNRASALSGEIAHLAAGELEAPVVLADLFAILSGVRMLVAKGYISAENGTILLREYEQLAERLVRGSHPSPFISSEDFSLPALTASAPLLPRGSEPVPIKDSSVRSSFKGHKGQSERMSLILDLVRKKKSLSIKEIAVVIKDCSEKTIQRELAVLIEQGLVRKVGERRWSVYLPA